jgi:S1-C subfamily serine protease
LDAAIIGFPGNGPLDIQPARLGPTERVISTDIYGRGPLTREMTAFRGLVRHGNSGGPVVDEDGNVRSVVFASSSRRDNKHGYGVPGTIVSDALRKADPSAPVSTGACA